MCSVAMAIAVTIADPSGVSRPSLLAPGLGLTNVSPDGETMAPMLLALLLAPDAAATELRVEDAVRLYMDHSHQVAAAEYGADKTRAEVREAFMNFFPSLSVSAGYTRMDPVPYIDTSEMFGGGGEGSDPCADIDPESLPAGWTVEMAQGMCYMMMGWMADSMGGGGETIIPMGLPDNYFAQAQVEQVVFAGGAMHLAYAGQKDLHEASLQQVRLARQTAHYDAQSSFYQLALAREAVAVTADAEEAMEAYVSDLQALVDVGAGSKADLLAAQSQHSKARLDHLRAAHGYQVAELAFKVQLGIDPGESIELVLSEELPTWDLPVSRDQILVESLTHRPDLGALDANLDAMQHFTGATWASWMPAVVVQGTMSWRNPNQSIEPEFYRSANLTVAASWTLWDRGAAINRHAATVAGKRQLEEQRDMLAEMMGVELQSTLSSFDEAQIELEVAQIGLEQAQEAYRLELERFEAGMANNTQLLAAHTALSGARLSLLQAEGQLRISHAALYKAIGLDPQVNP